MTADDSYTSESIRVLKGLEAVRLRPGMYIGDVIDGSGMHAMLWEVIGNAVDEFLDGHASYVQITFDGPRVAVEDDGRGIPIEALERVMTVLHCGTAWRPHHVHLRACLHGVGVAVVNGLSSDVVATIWRDGFEHTQRYICGEPDGPVERGAPVTRTGTKVSFVPDFTIFAARPWNIDAFAARCRRLAALLPGLTISVDDATYRYDSLVELIEEEAQCDVIDPFVVRAEHGGIGIDLAIAWTRGSTPSFEALVNYSPCHQGTHVDALFEALHTVLAPRLPKHSVKALRRLLSRGMRGVLHVRLEDPHFGSPTRDWLRSPALGEAVRTIVERDFTRHLEEVPALLDALLLDLAPLRVVRSRDTVRLGHGGRP